MRWLFVWAFVAAMGLGGTAWASGDSAMARLIVHYVPGAVKLGHSLGYAQVSDRRQDREMIEVPADSVPAVREDLLRRPGIEAVVVDGVRQLPPERTESQHSGVQSLSAPPPPALDEDGQPLFSDPGFVFQDYWADPTQTQARAGASDFGEAVKATVVVAPPRVAVLDSGVVDYPQGPDWSGGVNLVSDEEQAGWGPLPASEWRILPDYSQRCDTLPARHGSHIGAILAAPRDDGYGIAGILPQIELYAGRVLNCEGSGRVSDVVDAIDWAAGVDPGRPGVAPLSEPVDIINLSLGAEEACTFTEQQAIDRARARGVLVVAAAGNDPNREPRDTAPANCEGVLAVTAVDASGGDAGLSVGAGADLAGQGEAVAVEDDRNEVARVTGTSFSAPMVSASAALALANVPGLSLAQLEHGLRDSAIAPSLSGGAVTASDFGDGIVNAFGLLEQLVGERSDPRGAALSAPLQGQRSAALRETAAAAAEKGGLVVDAQALYELSVTEALPRDELVLFELAPDAPMTVAGGNEVAAGSARRVMVGPLLIGVRYGIQFCDGEPGARDCESDVLVPVQPQ